MKEVIISGVGKYIPSKVVTNDMLSDFIDTSDEWISTRTGIKTRYITTGEDTSDIASKAALQAIENSKINVLDIGLIIVATSTPDTFMPSTACIVQKNIGAKNAYSFDLSGRLPGCPLQKKTRPSQLFDQKSKRRGTGFGLAGARRFRIRRRRKERQSSGRPSACRRPPRIRCTGPAR